MGNMELGNGRRLFKESRILNWYDIDRCSLDRIGCDAEP